MQREKVIELGVKAGIFERDGCGVFVSSGDVGEMVEFARLVELETLEMAANKLDEKKNDELSLSFRRAYSLAAQAIRALKITQ